MPQQLLQITESRGMGLTWGLISLALDKLLRWDHSVLRFPGCKYGVRLHAPMKCYRALSNSASNPQKSSLCVSPLMHLLLCTSSLWSSLLCNVISSFFHFSVYQNCGLTRYKLYWAMHYATAWTQWPQRTSQSNMYSSSTRDLFSVCPPTTLWYSFVWRRKECPH